MPTPDRPRPELAASLPTLRARLEEQREFRLTQLAELAAQGTCLRAADPSAGTARTEVAAALAAAARHALADIEAALARMRAGRYGTCQRCDTSIALHRLHVIPQTGLCAACQRAAEPGQ